MIIIIFKQEVLNAIHHDIMVRIVFTAIIDTFLKIV